MGISIPILDTCVEKIAEALIAELLVQPVRTLIHYKKNLKDLEDGMKILVEQRTQMKEKIEQAKIEGDVFSNADNSKISNWLKEVDDMEKDIEKFREADNIKCFRFSCPNYVSSCRRSKHAEKEKINVEKLKERGREVLALNPHRQSISQERESASTADFFRFESRESAFKEIEKGVKNSKDRMILVYGAGGVGKTKMVQKVKEKVKKDGCFDAVVMAIVSTDVDVKKIQDDLASGLDFKFEADSKDGRAAELWNRLNNEKRNLVILDDIWKKLNLHEIGIPISDGTKGCKILMTSRNRDVCKHLPIDSHIEIQVLEEKEAWDFFKENAGISNESHELNHVQKEVCKKCGGLPVAILAVGEALKGEDEHSWKDALEQLQNFMGESIVGIDQEMYASLKLSYNYLSQKDEQKCFLLCCLFREDANIPIDELVRHCMAGNLFERKPNTMEKARNRVLSLVGNLKSRCLLLDGTDVKRDTVKMHDIIRDVAVSLAKNDEAFQVMHGFRDRHGVMSIEGRNKPYLAISLQIEDIDKFPPELYSEVDTLLLKHSNSSSTIIPKEFFSRMKELKILEFEGMHMSSLPSSLQNLVNLQMLSLNSCKLENIALLNVLREKMEILSLRGSKIKALPPEVGQLSGLRVLDLEDCNMLQVIPNGIISQLTRLEELYVYDFKQWEEAAEANKDGCINASLDELRKLEMLTTLHVFIPNLLLWPKDLSFHNLTRFKIAVGWPSRFYELNPDEFSDSMLGLFDCILKQEVNVLLHKAQTVYLDGIKDFKEGLVHDDRDVEGGFTNLKHLQVQHCGDLKLLLDKRNRLTHGSFDKLTTLTIWDCHGLKYVCPPSCVRALQQLQRLRVGDCQSLEAIVGIEEQIVDDDEELHFNLLKEIDLSDLPNLTSFCAKMNKTLLLTQGNHAQSLFNEKIAFPSLEKVDIEGLPKVIGIWNKELPTGESFCQLRSIQIQSCHQVLNLAPLSMLPRLQNLKHLYLQECSKMNVVISDNEIEEASSSDKTIEFSQLSTITLRNLDSLEGFCSSNGKSEAQALFNHKVAFPLLEEVKLDNLPNIFKIWNDDLPTGKSFCLLRLIKVKSCEHLLNLVPLNMVPRLQNLKIIDLRRCSKMNVVISNNDNTVKLSQVSEITLHELDDLESFCNSGGKTEALTLFNHKIVFPSLEKVDIQRLPKVTGIWNKELPAGESFYQLWSIAIWSCDKVLNLAPLSMRPRLQNLKHLELRQCSKMNIVISDDETEEASSCGNIVEFSHLRIITLKDLGILEGFYSSNGKFEAQVLFNHKLAFPALEELHISGLPSISYIWDMQNLTVRDVTVSAESYLRLRSVIVSQCDKLTYVFVGDMVNKLQNLETLKVEYCPTLQVIVSVDEAKQKGWSFPKLKILKFCKLDNLKAFCNCCETSGAQPLFNHQAACPALEELTIDYIPNITNIWVEVLPTESFHHLMDIRKLTKLSVDDCLNLEVIVSTLKAKGKEWDFPKLVCLELGRLPKLKSFCNCCRTSDEQPLFNHQFAFPALEKLLVRKLANFTYIWCKQNLTMRNVIVSAEPYCRLRSVTVSQCDKLMYVFLDDMVNKLQNLQTLIVEYCPTLQVIVSVDEAKKKSWSFPKLKFLEFCNLDSLKGFCNCCETSGAQPLFNHQVGFPLLEILRVKKMPNVIVMWDNQLLSQFQNICEISIVECQNMELVVSPRGKEEVEEEAKGSIILFPQLKTITMNKLNNFKGLYRIRSKGQQFFNLQIVLPALGVLSIEKVPKITEVLRWDKKLQLESALSVGEFQNLEMIVSEEGEDNREKHIFFQVECPNFKYLYADGISYSILKECGGWRWVDHNLPLRNFQPIFKALFDVIDY